MLIKFQLKQFDHTAFINLQHADEANVQIGAFDICRQLMRGDVIN